MKRSSPRNCVGPALPRPAVWPSWRAVSALLILSLVASAARAQNTSAGIATAGCGEAAHIQLLLEEVRAVRALVLGWKLEMQSERTKSIEQSLETLRGEKARLQLEQRHAEQQLAKIEAQIRTVTAGSEQHLQLEAEKLLYDTDAYQQKYADLTAREADLDQQLSAELKHTANLRAQVNGIAWPR